MTEGVLVISRRMLVVGALVVAVVVAAFALVALPAQRDALARAISPVTTADPATLAQQRTAAEHSIQRGYVKAAGQLKQVRDLTLAIPAAEADAIDRKARDALFSIRRQALAAVASAAGISSAQVEQYVPTTEAALDKGSFEGEAGVLLAPGLFDLVRRANGLFQQTADEATRQLTRAPGSPSPTARPSATATPSGSRSASPSPTGR